MKYFLLLLNRLLILWMDNSVRQHQILSKCIMIFLAIAKQSLPDEVVVRCLQFILHVDVMIFLL